MTASRQTARSSRSTASPGRSSRTFSTAGLCTSESLMTKRAEDTYYGLVVETYELFHPEGNLDDVPFYAGLVAEAGGPALELMCGSGRVLLPLLRMGVDADGVDCSPEML